MPYEVELKFPLTNVEDVQRRLADLGARPDKTCEQVDTYFAHPQRDFATTDEALRVRRQGNDVCITYKGRRDPGPVKSRREIELPVGAGDEHSASELADLLTLLGFQAVHDVVKHREFYQLHWQDRQLEICLDQVQDLGDFLEIETLADEADRDAAAAVVLSLAKHLELGEPESASYLHLLLTRQPQ
ncbi:class IV adenylate cyclase [Thalassoroseus pseudoceratinae]|uniref:class IV adenylate cyclase n=1 Tax=Thalassoroseus pseudoceratinae TaxID=2713176 RepID=UPI0014208781|nr:class IV adenylate cyclase [Thalassoroseus pseudoceratinae]